MNIEFGDYEPEDAWDADDPTPLLIDNLTRRCAALGETIETPPNASPGETLDELADCVQAILRRPRLSEAELVRADMIGDDIATLRLREAC